jgi:predicted O-methyltransferase YrrM
VRPTSHFVLWLLGLARPTTQTTTLERDCLARHAAGRSRLVEIGVWHGVTTHRLRSVMSPDGLLVAVDPYPIGRLGFSMQQQIAHSEVGRVENGQVEWLRCVGAKAAEQYTARAHGPVDFIFFDGDHSYDGLRGDWEAWSPLLAPGAVAALHDSVPTAERRIQDAGSVRYTEAVIRGDTRFELVEVVDSLTVWRRRSNNGEAA